MSRAGSGEWDWDAFYAKHRQPKNQVDSGRRVARLLESYFKSEGVSVSSLADVGCGPATTLFELAQRSPDIDLFGYDSSRTILEKDHRRAARLKLDNLHFGFAELPRLAIGRKFDVVICLATLHYVEDPGRAIRSLHSIVEPGGHLIFNYPNNVQRAATASEAEKDPVVSKRFALVLAGRNLLTRDVIAGTLGRRPESFWKAVGEPPRRLNPCVVITK